MNKNKFWFDWAVKEGGWPEIIQIIIDAAETWQVPAGLMLCVSYYESKWNPDAIKDDEIECSIGLFQMNMRGGLGEGHTREELFDPNYNANLAACYMSSKYEIMGSWWDAIQPWSVRPKAWELWKKLENEPS